MKNDKEINSENMGASVPFDATSADSMERRMMDREVPLPEAVAADRATSVVNNWLDGEATEAVARAVDARQVAFWKQMDAATASMRQTKTPAHLPAQIMAAIPVREPGTGTRPAPVRNADTQPRLDG